MWRKEKVYSDFLTSRLLVAVLLILIVLSSAFMLFTYRDRAYLHQVIDETMDFLRMQVLRYERYESRNAAFDMTQTTDRAKVLARNLLEKPELLNKAYLEDYAYSQRLDGIIVFDAQQNIEDYYCLDEDMRAFMLQKSQIDNVSNIAQHPMRSYMDQFVYYKDNAIYSYAVVGRLDKPGYILAYRKESTRADADSQSYMDGLFNSYGFELNGTVMITDGNIVLSSNRPNFHKHKLDDLLPDAKKLLTEESDGLFSINYNGETYYGSIEVYKTYKLVAFFPQSAIYADRSRNMAYVFIACVLLSMLLMFLHYRTAQGHFYELRKQYATIHVISSVFEVVFLLNLEKNKLDIVKIPEEAAGMIKPGQDALGWLKQVTEAQVMPEYKDTAAVFESADSIRKALHGRPYLNNEYQDLQGNWFGSMLIPQSYDAHGKIKAVLVATSNISETKVKELTYQKMLRETAREAQAASVAKTDFLRRMSHDIRTPLNGILGILEMANYYPEDLEKQQEYRDKVLENTKYLLDLSNDVLEMNKIESGKIILAEKSFDMQQMVRGIGMMADAQAKMRGISCEHILDVQHSHVIGSPVHLRQILTNVISNALKYNKENGSLKISCRELSCQDGVAKYEFVCADTGIGMSEEFQKHAFDMFAQENAEARTTYIGTGLGLAIVKRLVDLMGGTLTLESQKGVGTTITGVLSFKVDTKPPAEPEEEACTLDSLKGMKVLLVEDNALNMKITEFILEREGIVPTKAVNGQEAVNIFAASAEGEFDVILMDIMMPVMDGLTASRTIRAMQRPDAKSVPIIALSANAFAEDEAESRKAGINGHLAKPLDTKKLLALLCNYKKAETAVAKKEI